MISPELRQAQKRLLKAIANSQVKVEDKGDYYQISQRSQSIDIYLANNTSAYNSTQIS